VQNHHLVLVRYLLSQGAGIEAFIQSGEIALHVECSMTPGPDIFSIAKTLVEHVARIEAKNRLGATLLFLAFIVLQKHWSNVPDLANTLLQQGANRYITDNARKRGIDLIDRNHRAFANAGWLQKKDYIAT
jgi:hypothetical protein